MFLLLSMDLIWELKVSPPKYRFVSNKYCGSFPHWQVHSMSYFYYQNGCLHTFQQEQLKHTFLFTQHSHQDGCPEVNPGPHHITFPNSYKRPRCTAISLKQASIFKGLLNVDWFTLKKFDKNINLLFYLYSTNLNVPDISFQPLSI